MWMICKMRKCFSFNTKVSKNEFAFLISLSLLPWGTMDILIL